MASYGSIWVKINNPAEDLLFLQQEYNQKAQLPADCQFACAVVDERDAETPAEMEELSQRFCEAIFMQVQTVVDFFIYAHWKNGESVRQIQYCADEGWYEVQGEAETWEKHLFSEENKLRQLSYLDLERLEKKPDSREYADAKRSAEEIETVWSGQTLVEGCFYPMAGADDLYGLVMREFGLANPYV